MPHSLQDKVVIVTGARGNLGLAVVTAAANRGARVAMIDRAATPAAVTLAPGFPAPVFRGGVDLTAYDAAQAAVDSIAAELGGIDAVVNVAGAFRSENVADGDLAAWDLMYRINVRTAANTAKAALPHLFARGSGRIVNIGAMAAAKATAGMGPYAASKAGVARLTESLADELKDRGITVNAVLPSTIDTPQNRADMPKADFTRWVLPQAIAEVILFLLSAKAGAVTGALIPVTGRT